MSLLAALTDYNNPRSLGSRFRAARAARLKHSIERIVANKGRCRIIDLGGHALFWRNIGRDYLAQKRCHVTLLNVSAAELDHNAAALADSQLVTSAVGDACATDFADRSFDLAHSNSTVEHVGDWARMLAFASEVRRLAPAYFVQTPNFWFPIEPHFGVPFWHWLPEPTRVGLLLRRGYGYYGRAATTSQAISMVQECRLLDKRLVAALFPEAEIVRERFLGITKSLIAIRD